MSERVEKIKEAVERAGECPAVHLESIAVVEDFRNQTIWAGIVEVFQLLDHRKAKRAYGWSDGEGDNATYTAVLEIPPVDSAQSAVKVAVAAKARRL